MSKFKVNLHNKAQGTLDVGSNQRSVYIMGPDQRNRILNDGDTFTDSNYWKRFAYPQVSLEDAFIEILEDDGSIFIDNKKEAVFPKVYDIVANANSDFSDNKAEINKDTNGYALFAQITNKSSIDPVKFKLNGLNSAIVDLPAGSTQVFNSGDLVINLIEIKNESENDVEVQIVVSVNL
jgi:hypothetical protein